MADDTGPATDTTRPYPAEWEADVVLRDGGIVHLRPILPSDGERLVRFHDRQSAESIYYRFFSPKPRLSERDVERFTNVDHVGRVAFVALLEDEIIGVARYERLARSDEAEVAFFVDDAHNARGLGTLLLEYLAAAGRERGFRRFTATTLPTNRRMIRVFQAAGYGAQSRFDDDVIEVWFDIQPTDEALAAMDRRERQAEAASVRRLLAPTSVAVIGAGQTRGGLGHEVFRNIVTNGFRGPVYPVNPNAEYVMSVRAAATILDIPHPVDLAVIAVPAPEVPAVVEQCAAKGVSAVVILSAGFSEVDEAGAALERRVVSVARRHGLRVLGPNCLGLVNTEETVRLHATFAPTAPPPGRVGIYAASGTLSAAILDHSRRYELGLSAFVAAGNSTDVSLPDLLGYWTDDEATSAVLLYLRTVGKSGRFVRAARAASLRKPVVAVRSAGVLAARRSIEGLRHQRITEALVAQTGVIRVGTLGQLFDVGRLLADQPVPAGAGVAVVGNSDGAVALAAETCITSGLELAPITLEVAGRSVSNPIDLTYRAGAAEYLAALEAVAADERVHSVVVIHAPPLLQPDPEVVEVILDASRRHPEVTMAATMLGSAGSSRLLDAEGGAVPIFRFPDAPARALGRLAAYRQWLEDNVEVVDVPVDGVDRDLAADLIDGALGEADGAVTPSVAVTDELLAAYGILVAQREQVDDSAAACAVAERIGYPVVLKGAVRDRTRRSVGGGVVVDLAGEEDLRAAWERMIDEHGRAALPMTVQHMVTAGVDVAVTLEQDDFGTHIAVGLGGQATDASTEELAVIPLRRTDAEALVERSPASRVLPGDGRRDAVVDLVMRLAELADEHPEVQCVAANPVVVGDSVASIVDVTVILAPMAPDFAVRRLD